MYYYHFNAKLLGKLAFQPLNYWGGGGGSKKSEYFVMSDLSDLSYKYIGLWCSNSPNIFAKNYTYLSDQAKKTLYAIKSYTTPSLGKLHPNLALKLFDSLISPILMYGSENIIQW